MPTKLVRAQDILREKGYSPAPFDTAGFTDAVTQFFRSSDVSARLRVFSVRFIDYDDAPPSGFAASTAWTHREYLDILGWYCDYPLPPFMGGRFGSLGQAPDNALGIPFILVDEPYTANAVGLLKMMGFIVSRPRKWNGLPCREITLV